MEFFFLAEIIKADHKLLESFYFIKISYVLTGLCYESFSILSVFSVKVLLYGSIFQIAKTRNVTFVLTFSQEANPAKSDENMKISKRRCPTELQSHYYEKLS